MKFEPKSLNDGSLQITIKLSPDELKRLGPASVPGIESWPWDKTDYCVTCKGERKYTIATYGDIAANIEAAATCMKETGDPSYSLRKGAC